MIIFNEEEMKKAGLILASISSMILVGCGSTQTAMTSEERQLVTNAMNRIMGNTQGVNAQQAMLNRQQLATQNQHPVLQEPSISEKELLAKKSEVDQTGGAAEFKREKDGILIDSQMFVDYEGQISNFGGNRITGEFTYTIKNYDGTHTLKYYKANSEAAPIKIATIKKQGTNFEVKTITGKTLPGSNVIPTSDGFIIGRPGSAFRYIMGSNKISSINVLDDYHIAKYQNGDVASTGFILLEKNEKKNRDGSRNIFSSLSSLGADLGLSKHDDYVLVNINNGSIVPLDISVNGKDVAQHSNCRSKGLYNECENVKFVEALYDKMGLPNNSHYYWSVDWTQTSSGPIAFYKTSTKIKAIDINKKQVHTLFSRTLGVNNFRLIERSDGTVGVNAQLGFSKDTIENVEQFILTNAKDDVEPMQKLGD